MLMDGRAGGGMKGWRQPDLPEGPLRELNNELHRLHAHAGHVSSYRISAWLKARADRAEFPGDWPKLSHTSVHKALVEPAMPSWSTTLGIVEALIVLGRLPDGRGIVERVRHLWEAAFADPLHAVEASSESNEQLAGTTTLNGDSAPNDAAELVVLAVDDEPHGLDELVHCLRHSPHVTMVFPATDAAEALRLLSTDDPRLRDRRDRGLPIVDAVFSDIEMPGLSGMEMSRVFAALRPSPAMVFVTAHDDEAVNAFDLEAVDYVLKPYMQDRIDRAVARVWRHRQSGATGTPRDSAAEDGGT
jgi:CheY-like chemotaxis protein